MLRLHIEFLVVDPLKKAIFALEEMKYNSIPYFVKSERVNCGYISYLEIKGANNT